MQTPTGFPKGSSIRHRPSQLQAGAASQQDFKKFLDCLNLLGRSVVAEIMGVSPESVQNMASKTERLRPEHMRALAEDPRVNSVMTGSNGLTIPPLEMIGDARERLKENKDADVPLPKEEPLKTAPKKTSTGRKARPAEKEQVPATAPVAPADFAGEVPGKIIEEPAEGGNVEIGRVIETPWEGRTMMIIKPVYEFVYPGNDLSVGSWYDAKTMLKASLDQEGFLPRTRGQLATAFMRSGADWSLWIDADIVTPCSPQLYRRLVDKKTADRVGDEFLNTPLPNRLVSWGKTIVSAVYFDRHGNNSIMAKIRSMPPGKLPQNCLIAADWVATGCVLVHRRVFEDVARKFPETAPKGNDSGFFMPYRVRDEEGRPEGEDEAFFLRARDAGHPSYVDCGAICGHTGFCCYGIPDKF